MTAENCLFHGSSDCPAARELTTLDYQINRRVPAWTPKEGEAVFFRCSDKACPGILLGDSLIQYGDRQIRCFDLKPFSAEKIGKNWEEI
jgi:hypothetical protein